MKLFDPVSIRGIGEGYISWVDISNRLPKYYVKLPKYGNAIYFETIVIMPLPSPPKAP